MKYIILILLAALLCLTGCSAEEKTMYHQIPQEEAKQMMARDDGHIIVDVRRQDEYDAGHIPGAILVPNESIGEEQPEQLPDKDQIILHAGVHGFFVYPSSCTVHEQGYMTCER